MKFLLDTNICIYVINARPAHVLARFRCEAIADIGISAITAAELAYGVAKSGSARNRLALEKFFAPLEIVPFGSDAWRHYGDIRAELERRGQPIGSLDTLIAAHALALGTILVTNDQSEFLRVPKLRVENWV
ncbi:MAG: type II toxin-antitoxin system VapC family toxin [Methylococcaceae bacterium]|nr:type II toxin-antitoxin system VapC family toxin [Methylococcaceae bacterium]MCI0733134.1 type II toxin-antitoxin system VapC family toxin [Methylococcaceae bacterium]